MRSICEGNQSRFWIALVAVLVLGTAGAEALAAGPVFMPGFPLRAGNNVMLMWMPYPGAASYNVYRSEKAGGPYEKIMGVPANTHVDPNVPLDKTFYYVVKPVAGGKEGEASQEVAMKGLEPMTPPKMGGYLITADNKIAVRWDATAKAAFYNVFRSESEKGDFPLLTSVQDTKYTDSNVSLGKTYYYKVTAVSAANVESPKSGAMSVRLEKKVEEKAVEVVSKPVEFLEYFDVDGQAVLRSPADITADGDGNFYVTHGSGWVMMVNKEYKFVRDIGKQPADFQGKWGGASGIYFDRKEKELYVAFGGSGVRVFDVVEGKLKRSIEMKKPDPKTAPNLDFFPVASDVAVGVDGTVWVVEGAYYQLVGLNKQGEEVKRFGLPRENPDRKKPGDMSLATPVFIAVNPKSGDLYVMEIMAQRITVVDKDGKYVGRFGGRGTGPGAFTLPSGIAVDDKGRVFVGDRNQERIQMFDEKGKYLATLIDPRKKDPQMQPRIAPGVAGIATEGGRLFCSELIKERVNVFKLSD